MPALPENGLNDPFVRPNATIVVDGRRRVLSRDDSFIRRRPTTMTTASSESDDTTSSTACSTYNKSIELHHLTRTKKETGKEIISLNDRFNSSFGNASTTIKEAFDELATETERDTQKSESIGISDAVFKARAVEKVRRRMMLSKDDSFINRTDSSKLEPFHFSFHDGAFRRIRNRSSNQSRGPAHQTGPITTWKRPTLAESWDIANTLNIQSMESTRHVGSGINRNAAA